MDKIKYRLVYNRKHILNNQGEALIQIEASLYNRRIYFSTGIYVRPSQWDARNSCIINHALSNDLNAHMLERRMDIERIELNIWKRGLQPTLAMVREAYRTGAVKNDALVSFATSSIRISDRAQSSRENLMSTIRIIQRYRPSLTIRDVTYQFLREFDGYLRSLGIKNNTVNKHLKNLRTIINEAIKCGLMSANDYPFREFKMRDEKVNKDFLTYTEIAAISRLKLQGRVAKVRDAFLFCCYTGLRYSDFSHLSQAQIVRARSATWLMVQMIKTKSTVRIPISLLFDGKASSLLDGYNIENFQRIGSNADANKHLHHIIAKTKIQKKVTWHTARHTFATLLLADGVAITTVQTLLGHADVTTTQGYSKVTESTLINDIKKVSKKKPVHNW